MWANRVEWIGSYRVKFRCPAILFFIFLENYKRQKFCEILVKSIIIDHSQDFEEQQKFVALIGTELGINRKELLSLLFLETLYNEFFLSTSGTTPTWEGLKFCFLPRPMVNYVYEIKIKTSSEWQRPQKL